jgi:ElaA protein
MKWYLKRFSELSLEELYSILQLRAEVFVVEQNCPYQDVDGKDEKALHLFARDNDIVAYTRIFRAGDYFEEASVGRVVTKPSYREKNLGHELMQKSLKYMDENNYGPIHISAQTYLKKFYENHGFRQFTEEYLEDDLPHIGMLRN